MSIQKSANKLLFPLVLILSLVAFQVFNFSTTSFALSDLLGPIAFVGIRWSVILSIALCAIDLAWVSRLFTPEQGKDEPSGVWYLFGAWVLAAAMNATLTWWAVALAMIENGHNIRWVAVVVAIVVWSIRVLIIGTLATAGDQLFVNTANTPVRSARH